MNVKNSSQQLAISIQPKPKNTLHAEIAKDVKGNWLYSADPTSAPEPLVLMVAKNAEKKYFPKNL